jgi:tetratricopeptide (TPR) repeat protein
MKRLFKTTTLILCLVAAGARAQSIELADEYFKKGEFEKAAELYEKLSKKKETARVIHDNYLTTLIRLKDYDSADNFLKQEIKNFPDLIVYKADRAYLKEVAAGQEAAEPFYQELVKEASSNDTQVYQLQNFLYKVNRINTLIDLLVQSRVKSKDPNKHTIQLARAYLYAGKKQEMLEEVFAYGLTNNNQEYVERTIQDNIKEEAELEMLEKVLYKKIQENPSITFYNEILIWHFVQLKEFGRAFTQARALDRRLNLQGRGVWFLASLAYQNAQYRDASRMFTYILNEYPQGDYYAAARQMNVQSREEMVKTIFPIEQNEIKELIKEYEELINELGKTNNTLNALRNMALLYAFYLDEHSKAVEILEDAISNSGSNQRFKDLCKLDLGDIFILKNEPWEATLLYMQVEKTQKEESLGETAKLKNAKLYYYTGEFELAKEILDILKKATTREIANDAMQLSLLIQDNLDLDTTDAAMRAYAAIDLLLFQNKVEKALKQTDSLFTHYKSHSLADELLWQKANLNYKLDKIPEAVADLKNLLENYRYDILADDALFLLAKIYEEKLEDITTAMDLYRQMLQDFPGSIYSAESRKKFRELRGDLVF